MRNLKRALSLTLASVMLLGMMVVGSSAAAGYSDVDENDNVEAIEVLQAVEVMVGDDRGFGPDRPVTRNEMAVVMGKLLNLNYNYYSSTCPFNDVADWARGWVGACAANGIVSGRGNGIYDGESTVTAIEAASMMMRALGYFKNLEDYADGFQVVTVRQGSQIGIFNGIGTDATTPMTRNQVAQMALNALQANMVDFTGTPGIEVNGVKVGYRAEYTFRSGTDSKYFAISRQGNTTDGTTNQAYIQLGEELYDGDLRLNDNSIDDFGRPSRYWEYDGKAIGTYMKKELIRESYTTEVTYKDLYELLGSDVVREIGRDWSMDVVIDGVDESSVNPAVFAANKLNRTDKNTAGATGNGVLTQVFVDNSEHEITIAIINTYLAQAQADYNTNRENVRLEVYGVNVDSNGNFVKNTARTASNAVVDALGEDFAIAVDAKEDDFFLVTVANGDIQTMTDVETVDSVTLNGFKVDSYVRADGTQYDYADEIKYDPDVLDEYANANNNLKDTTYRLYLDKYGYLIGIEIVESEKNYVFISAYDNYNSIRSDAQTEATALFLDGTSATITVKNVSDLAGWTGSGDADLNRWYTYSTGSDGKYTLTDVVVTTNTTDIPDGTHTDANGKIFKVAQFQDDVDGKEINKSHVSLLNTATAANYAYGNDDTVYLGAKLKKVNSHYQITGVSTATTGVRNTNMKLDAVTYETNQGAYVLYNDKGYIIAAVVVGQNMAVTDNYAFLIGSVSYEGYDATADEWSWTRDAIINGEKVTLTEKNDANVLRYINGAKYGWYIISYDADNNVIDAEAVTWDQDGTPSGGGDNAIDGTSGNSYVDGVLTFNKAGDNNYDKEDVVLVHNAMAIAGTTALTMRGQTLYVDETMTNDSGLQVMPDAKAVLIHTLNGKEEVEYFANSSNNVQNAISRMDNSNTAEFNGDIWAVMKEGTAIAVIIYDSDNHTTGTGSQLRQDIQVISADVGNDCNTVLYTIEDPAASVPSLAELRAALVADLTKKGYSDFSWSAGALTYTDKNGTTVTTSALALSNFKWVYKLTLKNGSNTDTFYTVKSGYAGAGASYRVTGETVSAATLNMAAVYNGTGTGFLTDLATKGTMALILNATATADWQPNTVTHDFTVETGYVQVSTINDAHTGTPGTVTIERKIGNRVLKIDGTDYAKVGDTITATVTLGADSIVNGDDTITCGSGATINYSGLTVAGATITDTDVATGTLTIPTAATKVTGTMTVTYTVGATDFSQTIIVAHA